MPGFLFGVTVSENLIEITVLNWERHNPRKDGKKYPWFKVDSHIFSDDRFYTLNSQTKLVWFYVLAKCSQVNANKLQLNYKKCSVDCSLRAVNVQNAVVSLAKMRMISIADEFETHVLSTPRIEKNRIEKRKNITRARTRVEGMVEKIQGMPPAEQGASAPVLSNFFLSGYIKNWEAKYGTRPIMSAKDFGIAKRISNSLAGRTESEIEKLITTYFTADEPWFKTKAHDLATFEQNLGKLGAIANKPEPEWIRKAKQEELDRKNKNGNQ